MTHPIPLLDLKAQYVSIKDEIDEAVQRVFQSQYFILGPEVDALEAEIATYCGCKHGIGVSSGTDALLVSLMALGISEGDEVITSPFTFFATVGAILRVGAKPVFVDIDPVTFNMDTTKLENAITDKTKAIIPVHLFGQAVEIDAIEKISDQRGFYVIEDTAQAIGSRYEGKPIGSLGFCGCFSFFPSKNLGGAGDGGMITTNDEGFAHRCRVIRNQGMEPKYNHPVLGGNFRLDEIQAAVLRVKFRYLEKWTMLRRENAAFYTGRLRDMDLSEEMVMAPRIVRERHVFNQYVIRANRRNDLRKFLQDAGIGTEIYYPIPAHLQGATAHLGNKEGDFPFAEEASKTVLALPIYPELNDGQKDYVISQIFRFYGRF